MAAFDPLTRCSTVVIISANAEWSSVRRLFPDDQFHKSPLGEWFVTPVHRRGVATPVLFFHGGWGKVAAAASAQYVIDHCRPNLLVNLGTCGGFHGEIERGALILAERTIVYDIYEQMGDNAEHIRHYSTDVDLSWLSEPYPHPVRRTHIISGDRDLVADEIPVLRRDYRAVVGDWESASIAWVAQRNGVRCLILRGVSDLVGDSGSEAYGNLELFQTSADEIMGCLVAQLPDWLSAG